MELVPQTAAVKGGIIKVIPSSFPCQGKDINWEIMEHDNNCWLLRGVRTTTDRWVRALMTQVLVSHLFLETHSHQK